MSVIQLLAVPLAVARVVALSVVGRIPSGGDRTRGQSTAEYALVLLGAATVALVFLAWAGKTSRIGALFNAVLDTVIGKV